MNPFENTLFWVNSDIENTKYAIQISIERVNPIMNSMIISKTFLKYKNT